MEAALTAIESAEPGEKPSYRALAKQYGVSRSTLARRHQGRQAPQEAKNTSQKKLSPPQEAELVQYIKDLSVKGLPPTREMIQNYASSIADEPVSRAWVTRFLHRNADSRTKYEAYFDLLHSKMEEYNILPCNTYNMDEKGFLTGVTGRSERVFSRAAWERGEAKDSLQDGSREWATILATVCADGSALPPTLLFQGASGSLQSTWVAGIEADKHDVFVGSTPSGWTNNDTGLAWLEQVFNRCTKQKARQGRDWRLLILDGHGSHPTMDFIEYSVSHRILLAVFPSHSTHTLQPLDVVCFKPLSSAYTKVLTNHLQKSQGMVPIKKEEFFSLFWSAWTSSFKTEIILKSFEATGIWPKDRTVVLQRFTNKREELGEAAPEAVREAKWSRLNRLVRSAVEDIAADESKALSQMLYHLQAQNQLLQDENEGLYDALNAKERYKKRSRPLGLQQRQEYNSSTVLWSTRKTRQARARERVNKQLQHEEELAKANRKELQNSAKLLRETEKKERRVKRERAKVERDRMKAEQVAVREAKQAAQNTKRASQTSLKGKRKASRAPPSKPKPKRRAGGSVAPAESLDAAPAAPPKVNSHGRTITLPSRYK